MENIILREQNLVGTERFELNQVRFLKSHASRHGTTVSWKISNTPVRGRSSELISFSNTPVRGLANIEYIVDLCI